MRVVWSQSAINDLKAIFNYLNEDDPHAAAAAFRAIRAKADLLRQFPALGPTFDGAVRQLSVSRTPYVIIYKLQPDRVHLLRLFDSRQDWQNQLKDI
jgi:plasmid stabilization system protein ParE